MDQALSCRRFVLYIKPHKKTPSRREINFFPKVSKMAIFRKKAKRLLRQNFQKWPNFLVNFKEATKIGIQVL